jgi:glycosyltransferase involved in cell wall biosynthesis
MNIFIDALSARLGGGITYIRHILPALLALDSPHQFFILLSTQYQDDLIRAVPPGVTVVPVDLPATPLRKRWLFLQTGLVSLFKQHQIDLFYAPAESSYLRVPVPFVMMARNLTIYTSLEAYRNQKLALLKYRLSRQLPVYLALQKADRVVSVSHTFSDQVAQIMRLNPAKIRVVYHGVSEAFLKKATPPDNLPIQAPYFLMVSSIGPHKNYDTLLKAYSRLPQDAPHLLIAGKAADEPTYAALQDIVREEKLEGRVHFLGEVAYEKLPGLYQGALASVFASRMETFGHPLVEAMASQTPLIASNLDVCQELCQDAALYFEPSDEKTLAEHMQLVWRDESVRARLSAAAKKRAAIFSWQESARQLVNVFEEVARSP